MATITNKTDGLEIVDAHGDTYFIKYGNVKLIKSRRFKGYSCGGYKPCNSRFK